MYTSNHFKSTYKENNKYYNIYKNIDLKTNKIQLVLRKRIYLESSNWDLQSDGISLV